MHRQAPFGGDATAIAQVQQTQERHLPHDITRGCQAMNGLEVVVR